MFASSQRAVTEGGRPLGSGLPSCILKLPKVFSGIEFECPPPPHPHHSHKYIKLYEKQPKNTFLLRMGGMDEREEEGIGIKKIHRVYCIALFNAHNFYKKFSPAFM